MGFTKTEQGNDWVDYALFFLVGLWVMTVVVAALAWLGMSGFWAYTLGFIAAIAVGLWVVAGEPEDLDAKFKAENQAAQDGSTQQGSP